MFYYTHQITLWLIGNHLKCYASDVHIRFSFWKNTWVVRCIRSRDGLRRTFDLKTPQFLNLILKLGCFMRTVIVFSVFSGKQLNLSIINELILSKYLENWMPLFRSIPAHNVLLISYNQATLYSSVAQFFLVWVFIIYAIVP